MKKTKRASFRLTEENDEKLNTIDGKLRLGNVRLSRDDLVNGIFEFVKVADVVKALGGGK